MYRFSSIEEFKKAATEAYIKGLEEKKFTDFEAAALYAIFENVSYNEGYILGIVDAAQETGYEDKEARKSVDIGVSMIDIYVEASSKKLEELGLL